MSSAQVRTAVAQFLNDADVPGLSEIEPAPPWWADGSKWDLDNQRGSGALGALHIIRESESRLTIPALGGQKMITYRFGLMLFYQWLQPQSFASPDEWAWSDGLDAIIDGVKDRLRSDPNCGLPGTVWQSAQDKNDVLIQRDLPRVIEGKVLAWNVIEFDVVEIITA